MAVASRTNIISCVSCSVVSANLRARYNLYYFVSYYQMPKGKVMITSNKRIDCAISIKADPINI